MTPTVKQVEELRAYDTKVRRSISFARIVLVGIFLLGILFALKTP